MRRKWENVHAKYGGIETRKQKEVETDKNIIKE
jgi:hypothetical protein